MQLYCPYESVSIGNHVHGRYEALVEVTDDGGLYVDAAGLTIEVRLTVEHRAALAQALLAHDAADTSASRNVSRDETP